MGRYNLSHRSRAEARRLERRTLALALCASALLLGGCLHRRPLSPSDPAHFKIAIRELLKRDEPTEGYYEMLSRLQDMGPEVDAVLLALARDRAVNSTVRSNALVLLAERRAPGALGALERVVTGEESSKLRAAAVLGLQRLAPTMPEAMRLIRGAARDPSRAVRLNALQALDITDVETIRSVLEKERDPEVRQVAMQLISISEARGAPLAMDRRGALRTTGVGLDPQIVFRPARTDAGTGVSVGDLRVELPGTVDVPLSSMVEVVGSIVPAFFSPDRAQVVFESGVEIHVLDIPSRRLRSSGAGIAPRVVPFSNHFVYMREEARRPVRDGSATEVTYAVMGADFAGGAPERVGELRVEMRTDRAAGPSPVRRMVVAESPEGFVLRGEGITPFLLPMRLWGPTPRAGGVERGNG